MKIESVKDRMVFPQANADFFLSKSASSGEIKYPV